MKKYVTLEMILSWLPCDQYDENRIRTLFGKRKRVTVLEILKAPIPTLDAFWIVLREELIPAKTLRLFACDCAERPLRRERKAGREPDARSWEVLVMARLCAMGRATAQELEVARAYAAEAWAVDPEAWGSEARAARAAEMAASAEATAAARTAAWAARAAAGTDAADARAELQWQKRKLRSILKKDRTHCAGG